MGKRKYVDENGLSLKVASCSSGFFIYWGEPGEPGDPFDAVRESGSNSVITRALDWEFVVANRTVSKHSKEGLFATRKAALAAVEEANAALLEGKGKPWPEWAEKAKRAGWKPPRGWKP